MPCSLGVLRKKMGGGGSKQAKKMYMVSGETGVLLRLKTGTVFSEGSWWHNGSGRRAALPRTQPSARGCGSGLGSGKKDLIRGIALSFLRSVCIGEMFERGGKIIYIYISSPLSRDLQPSLPAIVSPSTSAALRARTMHNPHPAPLLPSIFG